MQIYKAHYRPAVIAAHKNNPLIETLPDYLEWMPKHVLAKLAKTPVAPSAVASRVQCTAWLNQLPMNFFVPTKRHYALFETIDLLIRQGYVLRNPLTPERAEYLRNAYARQQAGEKITDCTFEEEVHEQLTASLIGTSGMGKTRTVERILSLYPQLIEHSREQNGGPFLQITYLHIECPHDGSVNALCRSILAEVDRLTGNNYKEKFHITDRTTLETLKSTLVHILAVHYVGIIVIDEIQNLVSSRKNREDLFNFIVSLSNSLNVPLLFVGTPKIYKFLTSNMRTARRFGTRGFIQWKPLPRDSREWKTFVTALWHCSMLQQDPESIPEEIEDKLFECSFGIVEILLKLYILTQNRILYLTARKQSTTEKRLTVEAIDHVFHEYFENMEPILGKLHKGDLKALLELEDIVMPASLEEITSQMRVEISQEDVEEDAADDELRRSDVKSAIAGSLQYAGDGLPPVAQKIAEELIKTEKDA